MPTGRPRPSSRLARDERNFEIYSIRCTFHLVGFAEVDEGLGAEIALAGVCVGAEGLLVVGGRLAVVVGLVAAVSQAGRRRGSGGG